MMASAETLPSPEVANNVPSTVMVRALDAAAAVIATQTQTSVGVTDGTYTPSHVRLTAQGAASLLVSVSDFAPGGVFVQALATDPLLLPLGLGTALNATFDQVVNALAHNIARACRGLSALADQARAQSEKELRVAFANQIQTLVTSARTSDLSCP